MSKRKQSNFGVGKIGSNGASRAEHPVFLVDDDSNQSRNCYSCARYEDDIAMLQEKLMETHNKLIQQIDICRQQQIRIIQLSGSYRQTQNDTHLLNKQTHYSINRKNSQAYKHSMQPLIEAKTQLLRNDLQAMRAKVLTQITKSNKLKEENRQLQMKHNMEIQEYRERIKKLENSRGKLVDQNQRLNQEIAQFVKMDSINRAVPAKCVCGFEQKYYELDQAFMNQRTLTNQLIQENNDLQNKIHKIYESKAKNPSSPYPYPQPQPQHNQPYTQPKRKKHPTPSRMTQKQEFEATKNLIKKLEQAEQSIRNKHKD